MDIIHRDASQKYLQYLFPCYMTTCYPGSVVLINTFGSGHSPSPGSSSEALIQSVLVGGGGGPGKGQEAEIVWDLVFLKLPRQS